MVLKDFVEKIKSGELETELANAEKAITAVLSGQLDGAEASLNKLLGIVRLLRDLVPEVKKYSDKISALIGLLK